MKTIKIIKSLMVAMIVFITFTSFASTDPTSISTKESKMKRIVSRTIDFPKVYDELTNGKEIVSVDLNIAEDGRIVVKGINGNPTFTGYVKEKLEKIVIKNMKELTGKSFIYKFVFSK